MKNETLQNVHDQLKESDNTIERASPTAIIVAERWFDTIRSNPTSAVIEEACAYYKSEYVGAISYTAPKGNLETLLLEYPGISFYYRSIMVDVQQSRRWLEEHLTRTEMTKHNFFMYDEAAKAEYGNLKTTEAAKLAKADPVIVQMSDNIRLLAYYEHSMETLMEAFENIKYVLTNIVTIRKEKLEEVWIDPNRETTNA